MRAAGANRLVRWGALAALLGWCVPVMAADTLCDPSHGRRRQLGSSVGNKQR